MDTGTPSAGRGSGEHEPPILRVSCPACGRVLVFSGARPFYCGFCGKPLPKPSPESTVVVPPTGPEAPTLSPAPVLAPRETAAPRVVGGYRLLRRLGGGGMGTVYEAEDPGGHRVALKLIAGDYPGSDDAVERFRREGRLASAIAHPRCVFVYAADEDAGRPFIVMELMPGRTLADLVRERGPLPPGEAVAKTLDVLEGLQEAHRLGVVHRDIKPSNCFLEADGRVKVGDFGLSKSLAGDSKLTRTGAFLGTPLYSSPEQVRGEAPGPQSDVYSLAATLYCLLAGRAPFEGSDPAATLARIVSDPVPPLRALRPEVPPALERAVLRGLERDRQRRWRDLDEFREALLPFMPDRQDAAGRGARFAAFLVDFVVLKALATVGQVTALAAGFGPLNEEDATPRQAALVILGDLALWLVYFVVSERVWGGTLGKRLLRLEVRTVAESDRPGWGRALVRFAVFYALLYPGRLVLLPMLAVTDAFPRKGEVAQRLAAASSFPEIVGIGLLLSPMRRRNGWRLLHEFASGTRTMQLPEPARRRAAARGSLDDALSRPDGLPGRLGPFAVRGALRWDDGARLLLGEDRGLGRPVLLWLRPESAPPLSAARRACARATRPRWLAAGRQDGWQWDAFPAPAGRPLADLVAGGGPLAWPEARPVLHQLTDELIAAGAEGTLPDRLTTAQVWAHPGGALLLDVPFARDDKEAGENAPAGPRTLRLLARTAVLALEGRPRASARYVRVPLPEHAARLLGRLLDGKKPLGDAEEFRAELEATRDRPAEVTPGLRAAHTVVLGAAVFVGLFQMTLVAWLSGVPGLVMLHASREEGRQALEQLQAGAAADLIAGAASPGPLGSAVAVGRFGTDLELSNRVRVRVDAEERELRGREGSANWPTSLAYHWIMHAIEGQEPGARLIEARYEFPGMITTRHRDPAPDGAGFRAEALRWVRDETEMTGLDATVKGVALALLAGWPALWVLAAFAFRGGVCYPLMGLSLVRADGRRAGRFRCAWRALLVWAPPAALLAGAVLLDTWNWWAVAAGGGRAWVPWLAGSLRWASLALLALYPVLAVRSPRRAPHDRLAGTYLVPR